MYQVEVMAAATVKSTQTADAEQSNGGGKFCYHTLATGVPVKVRRDDAGADGIGRGDVMMMVFMVGKAE